MPPTSARRHSAPPGESDLPGAVVQPPAAVGPTEALHHVLPAPLPSVPGPAAAAHPAATAVALAAMKAELEADKAAAQVQAASLQAQLDRQAAATQQILGLLAELRPVPAAAPPRQLPAVAGPDPLPRSGPVSGPTSASHRTAVLDRTAASAASANLFAALTDGDSDDDAHEVPLHSHTRTQPTVILPAAFVPTLSGTEESAGQQLAAIFKEFGKQGGKVKYATIKELDEALDDWVDDSLRRNWTAAQVESIRAYQRLLITHFSSSERRPFKEILEYHNKWCKAVHNKSIDMCARGAELNHDILYEVSHPKQYGSNTAAATAGHRAGRSRDVTPAATSAATKRSSPAAGKYPTGSCTHHPTSTSHSTAECIKKG